MGLSMVLVRSHLEALLLSEHSVKTHRHDALRRPSGMEAPHITAWATTRKRANPVPDQFLHQVYISAPPHLEIPISETRDMTSKTPAEEGTVRNDDRTQLLKNRALRE